MRMSVTPVSASPARMAAGMGVAPRWRGSSEGWRLSAPMRRQVEQRLGHDAAVVGEHHAAPARAPRWPPGRWGRGAAPASARGGPSRRAAALDRASDVRYPSRPAGRGGVVTTPTSSTPGAPASASRIGTAKSPLPRKTVRVVRPCGVVLSLVEAVARSSVPRASSLAVPASAQSATLRDVLVLVGRVEALGGDDRLGWHRSMYSSPWRWSNSCWMARASRPWPEMRDALAVAVLADHDACSARVRMATNPGTDRQPS